jgi:ArsR family transcriptional regulator, arsenate/arsenite/antimonite-responsive transcriptional repressor
MVQLLTKETKNGNRMRTTLTREELDKLVVPELLVKDLAQLAKLLADETRLKILSYLTQRDELHVRALCDLLGESQPAVSHHLALLRVAGLIQRRREGKHNFYGLQTKRFSQILDLLFAGMPAENRRLRFENYLLQHAPAVPA